MSIKSLGSQDTEIKDTNIDVLKQEMATNMPTSSKRTLKKNSSANKPSSNSKRLMDDMANFTVEKPAPIKVKFYSLNWNFLHQFYSFFMG